MARAIELTRARKSSGTGTNHGYLLPVRTVGGLGTTQPESNPRSMMACSMVLIVTGESLMLSTHDPSQGAGQRGRELREIVGLVQTVERFTPPTTNRQDHSTPESGY